MFPGLTAADVEDLPYDWWAFGKQVIDAWWKRGE
jgi:hypothetical protein